MSESFTYHPGARPQGREFRAVIRVARNNRLCGSVMGTRGGREVRTYPTAAAARMAALLVATMVAAQTGARVVLPALGAPKTDAAKEAARALGAPWFDVSQDVLPATDSRGVPAQAA